MNIQRPSASWIALGAAVALWLLVGLFVWLIVGMEASRSSQQMSSDAQAASESSALGMRALARDTKDARDRLDTLAHVDVLSIIDAIDRVGTDADIKLTIGEATPETPILGADEKPSSVHVLGFVLQGQGSFASLMKAIAFLQSLPVPASLEELHLERARSTDSGSSAWLMTARIRALTTADI